MTDAQKQEYLEFAKSVAIEAGEIMRKYFKSHPDSSYKYDKSIVTVADKEINDLVIRRVHERYPNHDINGEEASELSGADFVWVCDPIDGTATFAMELPLSVFSLALVVGGDTTVGVIYAPFSEHLYYASKGNGAFCNDKRIQVSSANFGDNKAVINVDWWPSAEFDVMPAIHGLAYSKGAYVVTTGSTTHAAALVARGEYIASVFVGTKGKNVDIAAAKVIVEEAGGSVTNMLGEEQRYDKDIYGAIVSNSKVHSELVKAVKESRG